jgi:hypothetical protein
VSRVAYRAISHSGSMSRLVVLGAAIAAVGGGLFVGVRPASCKHTLSVSPLRWYVVGPNGLLLDGMGEWRNQYGVGPEGAVLVRADGHVARRIPTTDSSPETPVGGRLPSHSLSRLGAHRIANRAGPDYGTAGDIDGTGVAGPWHPTEPRY